MIGPLSAGMAKVYALAALFFTANAFLTVVIPLQAAGSGVAEGEIGVMMGVYMFVCMLLRPWAGQLTARRGVAAVTRALLGVHAAAMLVYVVFGVDGLYVVRALQGATTAFFSMAMQIGIGQLLRDEDRGQGMSMYSLSTVIPSMYGPAVALVLWERGSLGALAAVIVALGAAPLLLMYRSPLPGANKREEAEPAAAVGSRTAWRAVRGHVELHLAAAAMLAGSCVFGAISAFLPLYMVTTGHGNAALYLFLQAAIVVVSRFALRRAIPSDGRWHPGFVAAVLTCSAAGTALLAAMPALGGFLYAAALFNGIAAALLYPTLATYVSFAIPKASKPALYGVFLSCYDLGFALGGFAMGFVVEASSYAAMFGACSFLSLLAAAAAAAVRRRPKKDADVKEVAA